MMGLKRAALFVLGTGSLAFALQVSQHIQAGIIDEEGYPKKNEQILLSPHLPTLTSDDYIWNTAEDKLMQKYIFQIVRGSEKCFKECDWIFGNWFRDLDPSVENLQPNVLSVGPLSQTNSTTANFLPVDSSCLTWLDKQAPGTVIYIAFGTTARVTEHQVNELAIGLEMVGRPFLWVVRSDNMSNEAEAELTDGFKERTASLGKVVHWAPQEKVLAHPSVACYVTHCGWNSTIESISMGIPMLCCPHISDQFHNRTCICDGWKIGLELKPDDTGIFSRYELKTKVNQLLANTGIRSNASKLKTLAQKSISKEGSSSKNLEYFVAQLKN